MDRNIIDALYKRGLITTINNDLSKYNSIEEFIARNVSYVGATSIINDIMKKYANDTLTDDTISIIDEPVVLDTTVETPVEETVETPKKKKSSKKTE